MIVCVCNNITSSKITKLVDEGVATTSKDVYNNCNIPKGHKHCSHCPSNIRKYIKEVLNND